MFELVCCGRKEKNQWRCQRHLFETGGTTHTKAENSSTSPVLQLENTRKRGNGCDSADGDSFSLIFGIITQYWTWNFNENRFYLVHDMDPDARISSWNFQFPTKNRSYAKTLTKFKITWENILHKILENIDESHGNYSSKCGWCWIASVLGNIKSLNFVLELSFNLLKRIHDQLNWMYLNWEMEAKNTAFFENIK